MLRALLIVLVALWVSSTAAAHGDRTIHYVAAAGVPALGVGPCMSTPHPEFDVGGACRIQVGFGALRIVVEDAALGAIGFSYRVGDDSDNRCAGGEAIGEIALTIVMPCRYVTVIPNAGATSGDILFTPH